MVLLDQKWGHEQAFAHALRFAAGRAGTQIPTKNVRYEAPRHHSRSISMDARDPAALPDARATTYSSGPRSTSATGESAGAVRTAFEGAGIHPEKPADPGQSGSAASAELSGRSDSNGDAVPDASVPRRGLVLGGVAHFSQQQQQKQQAAALARTVSLSDGVAGTRFPCGPSFEIWSLCSRWRGCDTPSVQCLVRKVKCFLVLAPIMEGTATCVSRWHSHAV